MTYQLKQVEDKLRKAFKRAKDQVEKGKVSESYKGAKMGSDIGHANALTKAQNAPVLVKTLYSNVQPGRFKSRGKRLIQRGRFRYHWEPQDPGDIYNQKKVWKLHVADRQPYPIFLLRARLYLVLRGIPHRCKHSTATGQLYKHIGKNWKLTITEEALKWVGIKLKLRGYIKYVDRTKGEIRSPWIGKIEWAIPPPPPNGGKFVHENDELFEIRIWKTPSISKLRYILATVGGTVQTVNVKRGDIVDKNQLLIKLNSPYVNTSPF